MRQSSGQNTNECRHLASGLEANRQPVQSLQNNSSVLPFFHIHQEQVGYILLLASLQGQPHADHLAVVYLIGPWQSNSFFLRLSFATWDGTLAKNGTPDLLWINIVLFKYEHSRVALLLRWTVEAAYVEANVIQRSSLAWIPSGSFAFPFGTLVSK